MEQTCNQSQRPREPWNKGNLVGQKTPFKLKEIWVIRGSLLSFRKAYRGRRLATGAASD